MKKTGLVVGGIAALIIGAFGVWFVGSANPETPAGYVGYLTKGAVFGKARFYGLQTGPTSPGRTWMLKVTNISVTPYTYTESFQGDTAVLAQDELKTSFNVHYTFRVDPEKVGQFVEKFSTLELGGHSEDVVKVAYENFTKEPLRTFSRNAVVKHKGLDIKKNIVLIGEEIRKEMNELTGNTPFATVTLVVGNIQYPPTVADAVANKLAATQKFEQMNIDKETRVKEAEGIAQAMDTVNAKLTPQYLQYEAIKAQQQMVNSPNHTTIYIPVGPMGVPLVGTFDTDGLRANKAVTAGR